MSGGCPGHDGEALGHVLWLGGGSGGGKTTVARELAARHGLVLYQLEPLSRFASRSNASSHPLLHAFLAMDMDERWVDRSPEVMAATFHAFRGERFELVLEDLRALPADRPVLVEGFALLPRLVAPLLSRRTQAVWLLPTPEFRRQAFEDRGSTWTIPAQTSDPDRALANLLERDRLFTEKLRSEAGRLDLETIEVDGAEDAGGVARRVARTLGLANAPTADLADPQSAPPTLTS